MPIALPREIRKLVLQQFQEIRPQCDGIDDEALLIRDGQYCGHRYHAQDLMAVWFFEEDEIKVHNRDGHLIRVVCPSQLQHERRGDAA